MENGPEKMPSDWYKHRSCTTRELKYIIDIAMMADLSRAPLFRVDETSDETRTKLLSSILVASYHQSHKMFPDQLLYDGHDPRLQQMLNQDVPEGDKEFNPRNSTKIDQDDIPDAISGLLKHGIRNWDFLRDINEECKLECHKFIVNIFNGIIQQYTLYVKDKEESFQDGLTKINLSQAHQYPQSIRFFRHTYTEIICKLVEQGYELEAEVLHKWLQLTRTAIANHQNETNAYHEVATMLSATFVQGFNVQDNISICNQGVSLPLVYKFTAQIIALCLQNPLFDQDFDPAFYQLLNRYIVKRQQLKDSIQASEDSSTEEEKLALEAREDLTSNSNELDSEEELRKKLARFSLGNGFESLSLQASPGQTENVVVRHFIPSLKVNDGYCGVFNRKQFGYFYQACVGYLGNPKLGNPTIWDVTTHNIVSMFESFVSNTLKAWGPHEAQQVHNFLYISLQICAEDRNPDYQRYAQWLMAFMQIKQPKEGALNLEFYTMAVQALNGSKKGPFHTPFALANYTTRVPVEEMSEFHLAAWFEKCEAEAQLLQLQAQFEDLTIQHDDKTSAVERLQQELAALKAEHSDTERQLQTTQFKLESLELNDKIPPKETSPTGLRKITGKLRRTSKSKEPVDVEAESSDKKRGTHAAPTMEEKGRSKSSFGLKPKKTKPHKTDETSPPQKPQGTQLSKGTRGNSSLALMPAYAHQKQDQRGQAGTDKASKQDERFVQAYASPQYSRKKRGQTPRKSPT